MKGKPEGLKHMNCIPYIGVGFFSTEKANLSQDAFEKLEQFVVFMYENISAVTTVNAARQKLFSQRCKAINTYLHRAPRLPSPSTWGWTRDNHGSHYGQHFVRLRTRIMSRCTVAANKTVKQDASVQLPTSHVLPYATLKRFQCRLA